ncbi:DUF982 domain-containing protein [Mesorhizobium sp. MSK_1335]|uniref:DUF982 domain-containing protein n=1 Tax=Mesorhizobium montanum TaxID=3072323 RepID=A0ABU4ZUN9_9HYPH|nr:DUF982 domain-containing protein [Mesorhizobium sp. MSK_1335]MDX8529127.1 DUF982 domain-containing protein [Mesorhizobium sp. MSK_1335]
MRTHGTLWFAPPVAVKASHRDVRYEVNNVQAAAENLLEWPKRGGTWNGAVRVCLAALAGDLTPDDARAAFEAAAKEQGLLLQSG